MLDHLSLGVSNLERSRQFYDAVLRPLGIVRTVDFGDGRGSDYGMMAGPLGVEFTITIEPGVAPSLGTHCASAQRNVRLSGPSMPRRSLPAAATMERRDCATYTTLTTSLPMFLTQTGIESKPCAMHLNCLRTSDGQP